MKLILTDQIPSGKNAMGITRTGHHYAKPRFSAWRFKAALEIVQQKLKWDTKQKMALPLWGDVMLTISYRAHDKRTRDLDGMLSALFHLLTQTGLIENDGQIKGVTWQYPWRTEGPCVEMEIQQSTGGV